MAKTDGQPDGAASDTREAAAWLAALIFLWGGNYTWVKIAMADIGPLWFNVARYGGAALLGLAIAAALGRLAVLRVAPGEWGGLALVGLLQAFMMTSLTAFAMTMIDASQVVVIAYSVPVWALFWGAVVLGERVTLSAAAGAVLGVAGIVALADPFSAAFSDAALPGILAAVVGVNCWALGSVLYRRRRWQSGFWAQAFAQLVATALAALALAPLLEPPGEIAWTGSMMIIALYNALGPMLLGFYCWSQALSRVPAATAGQVMILAPLFGVAQSHLLLGEPLSPGLLIATPLVLAG
ncbi:MAG: DMT family transporter, partial [Pseudomonadota bacterium]